MNVSLLNCMNLDLVSVRLGVCLVSLVVEELLVLRLAGGTHLQLDEPALLEGRLVDSPGGVLEDLCRSKCEIRTLQGRRSVVETYIRQKMKR
jgi:hypothetical protein